jgi:YD repeat-containing protein
VGKILQVNDPTGTYAFAYDNIPAGYKYSPHPMGRLIGTTTSYSFLTSRNFTNAYTYDAASNRTGFTDPEGGSTAYSYDTLNRLTSLAPPSAFGSGSFGFTYDALSRRAQMTRPNNVTTCYTTTICRGCSQCSTSCPGVPLTGRATRWILLETARRRRIFLQAARRTTPMTQSTS